MCELLNATDILYTAGFQECLPYQSHSLLLVHDDSLVQAYDLVPAPSEHKPSSKSIPRAKGPPDPPTAYEFLSGDVNFGRHSLLL